MIALDEPAVREEILNSWESADVVNLIEDRQREDLAYSWDGLEAVIGLGVVLPGSSLEMVLDIADDSVVVLGQHEVDLHALAGIRLGEDLGHAFPVSLVGDLGPGFWKVVLVVGVL